MTPLQSYMALCGLILLALGIGLIVRAILRWHRERDPWPHLDEDTSIKKHWWKLAVICGAFLLAGHFDMQDAERFERTEVAQR